MQAPSSPLPTEDTLQQSSFSCSSHSVARLFCRAFSGTLISHDIYVVLDVMWLAGVLKPILDHRDTTENDWGQEVRLFHRRRGGGVAHEEALALTTRQNPFRS